MIWEEKEVASLELSKKLKELKFPQTLEEGWHWVKTKLPAGWLLVLEGQLYSVEGSYIVITDDLIEEIVKAPTNSELGEWLPFYLPELGFLRIEKNEDGFHYYYDGITFTLKKHCYFIEKIEANARAKTVIWLRENGYITFNQGDKDAQPRQPA